jgi:hypothetical protein
MIKGRAMEKLDISPWAELRTLKLALLGATALLSAGAMPAYANLVTNGGFETNGGNGQIGDDTTATGWFVAPFNGTNSYVFLWNAQGGTTSGTSADNAGAVGEYGTVKIWGPGNGSANGLTLSPNGGAFVGADGAFQDGALMQTLTGLTAGQTYAVTFNWAAAQQENCNGAPCTGPTSSGWQVDLGSDPSQSTGNVTIFSHGFSGWKTTTFDFLAQGSSETLSFLATGTGGAALPPFALLDGVNVEATTVPEPSTWAMMLLGIAGLGYAGFRTRKKAIWIV